jgi:hypothetical protein
MVRVDHRRLNVRVVHVCLNVDQRPDLHRQGAEGVAQFVEDHWLSPSRPETSQMEAEGHQAKGGQAEEVKATDDTRYPSDWLRRSERRAVEGAGPATPAVVSRLSSCKRA